ncbi:MAG: hypothetical protein D6732_14315 [Methanobacteriota archaeon]|nr:MAG: hypothetical protein D6732_14315 [Euryarchaeota archaeon]
MKMPCELITEPYISRVRFHTVKNLARKGLKQQEIANLLSISQGLVSSLKKREKELSNETDKVFDKLAKQVASEITEILLVNQREGVPKAIEQICRTCKLLRINGPTCNLHYLAYPELKKINCTACHGGGQPIELIQADRFKIISDLKKAIERLEQINDVVALVPEIGMQFIYTTNAPKNDLDVAGFPGRIRKHKRRLIYPSTPEFGASTHSSKILLLIAEYLKNARCLVTLKSSSLPKEIPQKIVEVVDLSFDTLKKSEVRNLLSSLQSQPPVAFVGTPAIGIEGITYLVGESPSQLVSVIQHFTTQK